jgi:hypothetical protein
MNPYTIAISVHVVTAILGLGQVMGTTVLASSLAGSAPLAPGNVAVLRRLGRGTTWSLVLLLLSGVLLEYVGGGYFHERWWFRVSFVLLIALGALQGRIGRVLRDVEAAKGGEALRGVVRLAWGMCVIVATIAILMEVKPW